jgi:hypothetical protein
MNRGEGSGAEPDEEKDADKWKEEIREDPYINESLRILSDM